jgi:hypothetical protein
MRELYVTFSSSVREHFIELEAAGGATWEALSAVDKAAAAVAISHLAYPVSQWWMPWYTNNFSEEQYAVTVLSLPVCCSAETQLAFHRYNRPQWRSRIAPLLHITEVRAVAADALWMSMCFERESLAIHFTWKAMPAEVAALLPDIEAALAPFAPRPHWGKLFAMRDVGRLYPRLDEFRTLCTEHDPSGKFASQWLREVGVVA